MLTTKVTNYGPTPFKLFNSWMYKEGFHELVKAAWSNFKGYGAPGSYIKAKLKHLKNEIKASRRL